MRASGVSRGMGRVFVYYSGPGDFYVQLDSDVGEILELTRKLQNIMIKDRVSLHEHESKS